MERARSPVVRVHLSRLLDGIRLFEKESSLPLLSLHFRILMSSIQYAFEAIGKMHYSRPIKTHNLHLLLSQYLDEVREIEELFGLEKGSDYPFSLGWREEMDAFRLSLAAQEGGFFPQGMGPKDAERLYNSLRSEKGSDYPFSLGWREEMDAFRLSLAAQEGGFFPQGMGPKDAERLYNSL